jgi:hypothetical protein
MAMADERVAIRKPNGAEERVPKSLGAVTAPARFAEWRDFVIPDGLLVRGDLDDLRPALLEENVSVRQDPRVMNVADLQLPYLILRGLGTKGAEL